MQVIVPFAAPGSDAGRGALRQMAWPHLARRLATAAIEAPEVMPEETLSTPAERALAAALDWDDADGLLPMACLAAADDGVLPAVAATAGEPRQGLALASPSHWHLGTEQVSLGDPEALQLDAEASHAFFALLAPLFESEGFRLIQGAPLRWYLLHPALATLPTASLDRVIGRNVDRWLVDVRADPAARVLRRVQNEVQMLLHGHALNAERERRGLPAVNSLWFSGSGPLRAVPRERPQLDTTLRRAALAEDWAGWSAAWALLDERLATLPWTRLTLCGERGSRTFTAEGRPGAWQRLLARARRVDLGVLLEVL